MFLLCTRPCLAIWKVQRLMFGSLSSQSSPEAKYRPTLDYSMDGSLEFAGFLGSRGLGEEGALQEPQGRLLRSSPCSGLQGFSPASGVDPRAPASCSAWSKRFHCSQGNFCCPVLSSFLMWLVQKRRLPPHVLHGSPACPGREVSVAPW